MKKMWLLFFCILFVSGALIGCTSNDSKITPLSEEELEYFNGDEFFNGDYMNIRNQFLSSLYDEPGKIDLFELFYCGSGLAESFTEAEKAILEVDDAPCPCEKNSRTNMDAVLTQYLGVTLADTERIGLENMTYLEEYDAYYYYHGDTNYRLSITFFDGEIEGDLVRLFYNDNFFGDGEKVLTLKKQDGSYLFISNVLKADK